MNLGKDEKTPDGWEAKNIEGMTKSGIYFEMTKSILSKEPHAVVSFLRLFEASEKMNTKTPQLPLGDRAVLFGVMHGMSFAMQMIMEGKINIKEIDIKGD